MLLITEKFCIKASSAVTQRQMEYCSECSRYVNYFLLYSLQQYVILPLGPISDIIQDHSKAAAICLP